MFLLDNIQNEESSINYFKNYLNVLHVLHKSLVLPCELSGFNHIKLLCSISEEKETQILSSVASNVKVPH